MPEPLVPSSTSTWPCETDTVSPSSAGGAAGSNRFRTSVSETTGGVADASGMRVTGMRQACHHRASDFRYLSSSESVERTSQDFSSIVALSVSIDLRNWYRSGSRPYAPA